MKTVLVVDDDPVFRTLLTGFLEGQGYAVLATTDSTAALAMLESGRAIDLAIVDIVLPQGGPQGVALSAMARLTRQGLPVLLVTASPELVAADLSRGVAVFGKPLDFGALLTAIRTRIGT